MERLELDAGASKSSHHRISLARVVLTDLIRQLFQLGYTISGASFHVPHFSYETTAEGFME